MHDAAHAVEELAIVSFDFNMAQVGHMVFSRAAPIRRHASQFGLRWGLHNRIEHILMPLVLLLHEAPFDDSVLNGHF